MVSTSKQTPTITFLGATQTVTGSRFLVTSGTIKVLVEAGLFQGTREIRDRNWSPFPINPAQLDAVILTHAHLDHCGYLPVLVNQGFSNPVYCTKYTERLAEVILRDSGRIQEEDANYAKEKGYSRHQNPKALYNEQDAIDSLTLFKTVAFRTRKEIIDEVFVTFYPSGHILGSSFVVLEMAGARILFTGDMGRAEHPVLISPDNFPPGHFDAVVTESTYGDRLHTEPTTAFAHEITRTINSGGSVLIPAFAVDRTEVILIKLRELMQAGEIPRVPIYADSPMALTSLDFYREAIDLDAVEIRQDVAQQWQGQDPFDPGTLHELRTVEQSKSLNKKHEPSILVSASGMATGGRVVHHLARMLPDPKNTVMLVGFQAQGTRGRLLEQGEEQIKIHGQWISVRANIFKEESFSVHADSIELTKWLSEGEKPDSVFVVHGETGAAEIFAQHLNSELGWDALVPKTDESFPLT